MNGQQRDSLYLQVNGHSFGLGRYVNASNQMTVKAFFSYHGNRLVKQRMPKQWMDWQTGIPAFLQPPLSG